MAEKDEENQVIALIQELDDDHSGTIDYAEFEHIVKHLLERRTTAAMVDGEQTRYTSNYLWTRTDPIAMHPISFIITGKEASPKVTIIELEHYRALHVRIAKSLDGDFTQEEVRLMSIFCSLLY